MTLTRTAPKTDSQIQTDVLAEIARDWRFKPAEIGVEVDDGVVTLTGTVSSYLKLGEAAELATGVEGVADVANRLTVVLPGASVRDDTDVARAVRAALEWNPLVPEERIDAIVRGGIVRLTGTVGHWYERAAAVNAVRNLIGVRGVNDHLAVVPPKRTDAQIRGELKAALVRLFPYVQLDAAVSEGVATLTGSAHSYVRREAERITWATTGVKDVRNAIRVE